MPLFAAALWAFLLGTALQLQQGSLWPAVWYADGLGIAAVFFALFLLAAQAGFSAKTPKRAFKCLRFALLCLAALLLGFCSTAWRAAQQQAQALPAEWIGQDVTLVGHVVDLPQQQGADWRFQFAADAASLNGRSVTPPPLVLLSWYGQPPYRSKAQAAAVAEEGDSSAASNAAAAPTLPNLEAGQQWQLQVRLKPIHGARNPFGFDYELWAFERGILVSGSVRGAQLLQAPPEGWRMLLPHQWSDSVARARAATRTAIAARIRDGRIASILTALVMGEQSGIERSDWDLFRATGVSHLMSISGLHITLFAWLAMRCIAWGWRRSLRLIEWQPAQYAAWLGGLILACAYAYFAGWGIPAQRTSLMLLVATVLRLSGKQWPWHFSLLLVAAIVLAVDPWALMQAGFWLSFVAVGVLLLQNPRRGSELSETQPIAPPPPKPTTAAQTLWQQMGQPAWGFSREQLRISLALAPLSLILFQQFSLIGVLANLIAIPAVTFLITPLALLGLAFHPLWQGAAWCLHLLLAFLQWCAQQPFAVLHSAGLPWPLSVLAVASVLIFLYLRQQQAQKIWQGLALAAMVGSLALALHYEPQRPAGGQFDALFADIGQGNAVLVRTRTHNLLYDTGPRYGYGRGGDAGNAGDRVLLPLLRALAAPPDMLVVSHQDSDHSGGAVAILQHLPPRVFYTSMPPAADWPAAPAPQHCQAGMSWDWDGVHFEFLRPLAADYEPTHRPLSTNAMSCVLRVSNGAQSLLLAGDLPAAQEQALVDSLPAAALASTVLLVPHHGSKTSSSPAFLQAVAPRWGIIQSGYLNRYGHPAPLISQRYQDLGIATLNTARCGAITWTSATPTQTGCLRRDQPHYWQHNP